MLLPSLTRRGLIRVITLEGVEQGQQLHLGVGAGSDVVITTRDGLHLHLPEHEGARIIVRLKG
jgi:hypothetical protein